MKATGIVRRIDDLGRVVIPKEIRRTMRIREGDPLEIYTDREGEVIFKKYSPIGEMNEFAAKYAETLHKTCDLAVAITDRDTIIACAGIPKREYQDKRLSDELEKIMEGRSLYQPSDGSRIFPTPESSSYYASCVMPIITDGDVTGSVVSLSTQNQRPDPNVEEKLIRTAASFLGKQMET